MHHANDLVANAAASHDFQAVVELWQRFMREERPTSNDEAHLRHWSERVKSQIEKGMMIIANRNGQLIGFLGIVDTATHDWIPAEVAYVADLYVCSEARSVIAVKRLFDQLLKRCDGEFEEVWTNTSIQNHRMQVLLKRVGFLPLSSFEVPGMKEQVYFRRQVRPV